ncbi:MAG: hypothetical protein IPK93_10210 [Solirubrobacterales bacterium]|nr:hypothetical protein [Solirubrobacterales bacterium]
MSMIEAAAVTATFDVDCSRATLKLKHLRKHRNRGTAHLTTKVGLAGVVSLRGSKKIKRYSRKVGAGKARLKVRPRGRFAKRLKRRGRLTVRVKVLYRPAAGCLKRTRIRKFTLVRRR